MTVYRKMKTGFVVGPDGTPVRKATLPPVEKPPKPPKEPGVRGNPSWKAGGQSPNPAGRLSKADKTRTPKQIGKDMAIDAVPAAMAKLKMLMNHAEKESDQIKATELILAYAIGRPKVSVDVDVTATVGPLNDAVKLVEAKIREREQLALQAGIDTARAVVIDAAIAEAEGSPEPE